MDNKSQEHIPLFGSWTHWYVFVLLFLVVCIILFFFFTKYFA